MTKTVIFLCHLWLGDHTQLYLTERQELCYSNPSVERVHVEVYNPSDTWERRRLGAICGWSHKRCPIKRS